MAAMRGGAAATDDYLAEWRRGEPAPCSDDLEAEATATAERLEAAEYPQERLVALAKAGGKDSLTSALRTSLPIFPKEIENACSCRLRTTRQSLRNAATSFALRFWSIRHARFMESAYALLGKTLIFIAPALEKIGWERLERRPSRGWKA